MIVISDDKSLHGIGGVMGGFDSGCSIETKNVFLEVALFDPISITKTGRKLNLQSDARYRFERGVDSSSIEWGVDIATKMIMDLCGGEVSEIVSNKIENQQLKIINYDASLTQTYGGIDIDINEQKNILEKLGFKCAHLKDSNIKIIIPSFRPDIDGPSDIVEEIIRIYGFDKIVPISLLKNTHSNVEILSSNLKSFYKSKRLIANRGYLETVTYSFMDGGEADFITGNSSIKIKNPINIELNTMRPSTFPNLLAAINSNISRLYISGKLFEVGPNFHSVNDDGQNMVATGIQYGLSNLPSWNNETRSVDIYDVKSDVFYVLEQLNIPIANLQHEILQNKIYHPGKSAQLRLGKSILASYGEISPVLLKRLDINSKVSGFEIFLDELDQFQVQKSSTKKAYDNNPFQLVERDFAFVFDKGVKAIDVINKIKKIDKKIIKNVVIFDLFEGNKLPENKKSIALKVTLQPQEKTFTDQEIENLSINIIDLISQSFQGSLRQ
jgi:phenylalanyl-tRNA synthetase beta chain